MVCQLCNLTKLDAGQETQANRIFYLSIPPSIFTDVAACASQAACSKNGWTRVIVEKPFGKDSESFQELSEALYQHLTEDQIYRIDHYLGKELIENLTVWQAGMLMPGFTKCHCFLGGGVSRGLMAHPKETSQSQ